MVCPPVCGDNPRATASRFSPIQVDKARALSSVHVDKLFYTANSSIKVSKKANTRARNYNASLKLRQT